MENLRIPGPTPCPEPVLQAMTKQMVNHRGSEFAEITNNVTASLKNFFQTKNDLFILTGSGTGGMEAAIVNMLSAGDKVLSVSNGVFGDRFATIATTFGADVTTLKFEQGKADDVDAVKKALDSDPKIKAVLLTHNETSTGVTNPLEQLAKVVKSYDKLLIVDCISSMGSIDVQTDKWGIDVALSGSQKGWMVPPGLAFAAVSEKAWKAHAASKMPKFYWDFAKAKKYLEKGQTPWTPAVSVFYAMNTSLKMMEAEGLQNIFARHAKLGAMTRKGVKDMGLKLLAADEKYASNTVTAVWPPAGIDPDKLRKTLREKSKVVLSGGQGALEGKIFRIGHLGMCNEKDIENALVALKSGLKDHGFAAK
ncbi:MAG: alanine--glyoxylate aminotransferase family protein [Dehalococcoidales bacterium]|nr:alanine--glyoxylate aminotransferase family protein [Dehalococcoidales bacterium]